MKGFLLKTNIVLFFSLIYTQSYADGLLGGQITYKLIDTTNGKYRITLELYNACHTITLGGERISVFKAGTSAFLDMSLVSKEEVTPIALPPDVANAVVTNCPSGAKNGILGINKYTYQAEYTVGKNIGWAYFGYASCCRLNEITNVYTSGFESIWLQAAINTNFQNSSPTMNTPRFVIWTSGIDNDYDMLAEDLIDPKTIRINGKNVIRDSFSYELINPFMAQATNPNTTINLQNPQVQFNNNLMIPNFLKTIGNVTINQKTGIFTGNPVTGQIATFAYVVKEYRAVPNAFNTGYTREYIGHTMRESIMQVGGPGMPITFLGIDKSQSSVDTLYNNFTAGTCNMKNKIVFQVKGSAFQNIKITDKSVINSKEIKNYKWSSVKTSTNNVETLTVTIEYDKINLAPELNFRFFAYYVISPGLVTGKMIPIKVLPSKGGWSSLPVDTVYLCSMASSALLDATIGGSVSWTPKTNILSAQPIDSGWIEVAPTTSKWYKVNNLKSSSECKLNDSIFVKIIGCDTVKGYVYVDGNTSCSYDLFEKPIKSPFVTVRGVNNSYSATVQADSTGYYWVTPPNDNNYILESEGKYFNCHGAKKNEIAFYMWYGNKTVDVHVRDSGIISEFYNRNLKTEYCSKDTVIFDLEFYKSFGFARSYLYFGDGDSIIKNYPGPEGVQNIYAKKKYNSNGTYYPKLVFLNKSFKPAMTILLDSIQVGNCIESKVYTDLNNNCSLNSNEELRKYHKFSLKNLNTNKSNYLFSDEKGELKFYFNTANAYQISNAEIINCNSNLTTKNTPVFGLDTNLKMDFPLKFSDANYVLQVVKSGEVASQKRMRLRLFYTGTNINHLKTKTFQLVLPPKTSLDSFSANATLSSQSSSSYLTIDSGERETNAWIKFDNLIPLENLCFQVRLIKRLDETDSSDNYQKFCIQNGDVFEFNFKSVHIPSQTNYIGFLNKNDVFTYQINFQNTDSGFARNVVIEDDLDVNLDETTLNIMYASHPMRLSLDANRKIKFIFENINLANASSNLDMSKGVVIYSIKPKSSLILNESILNKASIKFDNRSEQTNTVYSKWVDKDVSIKEKNQLDEIKIYPNPVQDMLEISIPNKIPDFEVKIMDISGAVVFRSENQKQLSLSELLSGLYLMTIESRLGTQHFKLIKK